MEQSILTALEIKRRLVKRRLTFFDIREDIANLTSLYDHVSALEKAAQILLRSQIRRLIHIVADLAAQLEERTNVQQTNWIAVLDCFDDSDSSSVTNNSESISWAEEFLEKIETQFVIGAGGFGSCTKVLFGGKLPMAFKIVSRQRISRLKQAAGDKVFASMTQSRYLCRYYACIAVEDYYLSMQEYIRGIDLQKCVKSQSALPVNVCRVVLAQLGHALRYLQLKGFIHRDIKPSNIMIMQGCRIKLIDYDTAKICTGKYERGPLKSYIRKTFTEFCDCESAGTLMYLAPEIIKRACYGRASDWCSDDGILRDLIVESDLDGDRVSGDADLNSLSRRLMCKDVYKRITVARFSEFQEHPFFKTIDWTRIEKGKEPLESFALLNTMLDRRSNGRWSPKREVLVIKARRRKRIVDVNSQTVTNEALFTYLSEALREMMGRSALTDESISEGDLSEPTDVFYSEVQKPSLTIVDYRFKSKSPAPPY
ncbi:microtubule-associated serine/threonine-protein kinase 2 [Galendromus occidentalis]|uniref:Serine/threonine-protein kinase greatwall n=1 Tax=Galendromus occidentalis TaxID=34638 RepID=A0AAJ7P9Z8_9ACAR|nr:microtubule-associated serine/threonine-protein kinase 2 [Galendromus occidentalis]